MGLELGNRVSREKIIGPEILSLVKHPLKRCIFFSNIRRASCGKGTRITESIPKGKTTGQKPRKRDSGFTQRRAVNRQNKSQGSKGPSGRFRVSSVEFKQKLPNQPNRDKKSKPRAGKQTKQLTFVHHLLPARQTLPGTGQILTHLILMTISGGRCYYHHFTEQTELQKPAHLTMLTLPISGRASFFFL